jgi:hypothetical protein
VNNRKCTKCLIPFLPTLLDSLERHGYLHLTQESKKRLLSLSPATADRLLRASRIHHFHGISTTRTGTLLKQQIFAQWSGTQPGFVEADLVAHCGMEREAGFSGGFMYTLTMTDTATGWTECLPLLYQYSGRQCKRTDSDEYCIKSLLLEWWSRFSRTMRFAHKPLLPALSHISLFQPSESGLSPRDRRTFSP